MISADEKVKCLEGLKSAYQALKFYQEGNEGVKESAFSLTEYAIKDVAASFGLRSAIKDRVEEETRENRERNERITQLEKEIAEETSLEHFKENIRTIHKKIEKAWKSEGFSGTYNFQVRETGKIGVELLLNPISEEWDLLDEFDSEEEIQTRFIERRKRLESYGLATETSGKYLSILRAPFNEEKIEKIIKTHFPTATIWEFKGYPVLQKVEILLSDVSFLEEI